MIKTKLIELIATYSAKSDSTFEQMDKATEDNMEFISAAYDLSIILDDLIEELKKLNESIDL